MHVQIKVEENLNYRFGLLQGEQPKQFFGSRNFLALIFSHDGI